MKSSSMRKSCFRAYSRMARRWLRTSCCAVETRRLGDGLHGLSMEFVFGCFIGQIRNTERGMFHAAELFGPNGRLFLTESCRSPTPDVSRPRLIRDASFLEDTGDRVVFDRGHGQEADVRRATVDGIVDTGAVALVLPQNVVEPLIGQVVLEMLDLIADCTNRTLTPRHPAYPVLKLKAMGSRR